MDDLFLRGAFVVLDSDRFRLEAGRFPLAVAERAGEGIGTISSAGVVPAISLSQTGQ